MREQPPRKMTLETLTTFLGWCTVINFGLLIFSTLMIVAMRGKIAGYHSRLFGLSDVEVNKAYFSYLSIYKIGILLLNFVPWIALKVMAG